MSKPTKYGVRGNYNGKASEHPLYFRWMNMLRRCYEPTFHSYEAYERMPVYRVMDNGKVERFESITVAEKLTGIHRGNIARSARTHFKAGGYKWRYADA